MAHFFAGRLAQYFAAAATTLIYLNASVRLSDPVTSTGQASYLPVEPSPLKAYVTIVGAVLFALLVIGILLVSYVLLTNQTIE